MIIENPVLRLDYNPATDVLHVEWPDVKEYTVAEAEYAIESIVSTLRLYDIKYLLADTRKGVVEIPQERYKTIITNFAVSLVATRVRKLARVVPDLSLRAQAIQEVKQETQLKVEIQTFMNVEEATQWLTA
ncbi:hypothetical protein POKO110462_19660 [Pontibacter korlensis]|uniref:STAS/SEC14 domain-containing protein n=1 Tax=Pontibacter korlensis TaxID=400092 RepID=A0A0E3UY51_9BACT|nr:hypothetical protein [Pontibacter korlensis]AKD04151.1 hypothetical protein PKOR_14975 [Pontibacter korlensis]